jgi:hypothetical protein
MVNAVPQPPRLTLQEAEDKLLQYRRDVPATAVELRRAFETPPHVAAEDTYVEYELHLPDIKVAQGREELATAVARYCVNRIAEKYSAPSANEAKVILKLYICEISAGKRQDRILATETGRGSVIFTLAWILTLKDGTVVLDGGRLFEVSTHMYGLGDLFRLQNAEKTLYAMARRMTNKILQITAIKSLNPGLCGAV